VAPAAETHLGRSPREAVLRPYSDCAFGITIVSNSSLRWTAATSSRAAKKRSVSTEPSIGSVSGLPVTTDRRHDSGIVLREDVVQHREVGEDRRLPKSGALQATNSNAASGSRGPAVLWIALRRGAVIA